MDIERCALLINPLYLFLKYPVLCGILACLCIYNYHLRTGYFGKILKDLSPEKNPNLKAQKRGCAVNLIATQPPLQTIY